MVNGFGVAGSSQQAGVPGSYSNNARPQTSGGGFNGLPTNHGRFSSKYPPYALLDFDFDGKQLLTLVRSGNSPFHGVWDIDLLIQEIEENLGAEVIDIPVVFKGSNKYVSSYLQSLSSTSMLRLRLGGT